MSESANKTGIQSLAYVEQFYADYRRDPNSVPAEWGEYFSASANPTFSYPPSPNFDVGFQGVRTHSVQFTFQFNF